MNSHNQVNKIIKEIDFFIPGMPFRHQMTIQENIDLVVYKKTTHKAGVKYFLLDDVSSKCIKGKWDKTMEKLGKVLVEDM